MIYLIVRRLSGFQYSAANMKASLLFILILVLVLCGFYGMPYPVAMVVGILVLTATTIYSFRQILNLVSPALVPRPILRVLEWFRLVGVTA
jgi:antigen flippase